MGGWYSSQGAPDLHRKTGGFYDVRGELNENKEHCVVIPVDPSKQAEAAFECT